VLKKISIDTNLNFIMSGNAESDDAALAFKDRLKQLPFVKAADLPLSKISKEVQGTIFFQGLSGSLSGLPASTPAQL
jgi:hypothetical protein